MPSDNMKTTTLPALLIAFSLLTTGFSRPAYAATVSLDTLNDTLSISADNVELQDILKELARSGVTVEWDPSLTKRVSADFTDTDCQEALNHILDPFNFTLSWQVIQSPQGRITSLSRVQIFREGKENLMESVKGSAEVNTDNNNRKIKIRYVKDELLLQLKPGATVNDLRTVLADIDGTITGAVPLSGVYRIRLPKDTSPYDILQDLKDNEHVSQAEPNYVYPSPVTTSSSVIGNTPSPSHADAVSESAPIAVLDTGFSSGSGLDQSVVASLDATDPRQTISDENGHGTQMAMIASGYISPFGAETGKQESLNPIIAVKTFGSDGYSTNFDMLRSMEFAVNKGAKVINLSWGSDHGSGFLHDSIRQASKQDVLLIASAGNEPTGRPVYPAAYPEVVSVAALNSAGTRWEKSNYGHFVDMSAPGFATMPSGTKSGNPGLYGGTSISSAYVANALSRYRSLHPKASASDVKSALISALTDAGQSGKDKHYGSGVLDADAMKRFLGTQ